MAPLKQPLGGAAVLCLLVITGLLTDARLEQQEAMQDSRPTSVNRLCCKVRNASDAVD